MLITRVYKGVRRIQTKRHCCRCLSVTDHLNEDRTNDHFIAEKNEMLEDITPFCGATHMLPCFELLVTSAAGFKAMVAHLHCCMQ